MENELSKNINRFIKYLTNEKRYPDTTITSYTKDLDNYYSFIIAKKINYKTITKDEIRSYLKYLDELKYSKSTISRILSTLRHFYTYLVINKITSKNEFKLIKNPKKDKKLPNFLQSDELDKIFSVIDTSTPLGLRNRLIIELLYATGLRVSEITSLKVNDIDLNNHEIKVFSDLLFEFDNDATYKQAKAMNVDVIQTDKAKAALQALKAFKNK